MARKSPKVTRVGFGAELPNLQTHVICTRKEKFRKVTDIKFPNHKYL